MDLAVKLFLFSKARGTVLASVCIRQGDFAVTPSLGTQSLLHKGRSNNGRGGEEKLPTTVVPKPIDEALTQATI